MAARNDDYELRMIAGAVGEGFFPPRLNTTVPATELAPDETPEAYGMDLTKDGLIGKGTIPATASRVVKTVTIGTQKYVFHFKRLWRVNGTTLIVGAQNFDDAYYQQGPDIPFNEDSNAILKDTNSFPAVVPFGPDFLFIPKATGGYALQNCGDSRGSILFQRSDIIQEAKVGAANRIVELNGNIYVSNDKGLMMLDSNLQTSEITRSVRNELSTFGFPTLALAADYQKRYVVGGSTFVFDSQSGGIYRYNGTAFRFTTRKFHFPDYSPFNTDRVIFVIEHGNSAIGTLKYQVRLNDQTWSREKSVSLKYENQNRVIVGEMLTEGDCANARTMQMRITSLSANKYIKAIFLDSEEGSHDDGFDG